METTAVPHSLFSFLDRPYDLRREPLERRKATLASILSRGALGMLLNEHIEHDGPIVFDHACRMGLESIVSKRKASPYRSGRTLPIVTSSGRLGGKLLIGLRRDTLKTPMSM